MTERELIRPGSTRLRWALAGLLLFFASPCWLPEQSGDALRGRRGAEPRSPRRSPTSARATRTCAPSRARRRSPRPDRASASRSRLNQPLLTGDLVRVESGSRLELALSDRNRLFLDADSSLVSRAPRLLGRPGGARDRPPARGRRAAPGGRRRSARRRAPARHHRQRHGLCSGARRVPDRNRRRQRRRRLDTGGHPPRVRRGRHRSRLLRRARRRVDRRPGRPLRRISRSARPTNPTRSSAGVACSPSGPSALRAARATSSPISPTTRRPLDEAGDWIEVDSVCYWRPYVSAGWRPYWQGRWAWTPSGYTWVSDESWGWVPYHYGRWCSLPGYGWAWRPGAVYSPAWVYWNWTSGYAGWVPMGYYSHFYDPWYRERFPLRRLRLGGRRLGHLLGLELRAGALLPRPPLSRSHAPGPGHGA